MLAAEEWHKYEESYRKYGLDLEPEEPEEDRLRKEEEKKATAAEKKTFRITSSDKILFLGIILAVAAACLFATGIMAWQSDINYNIYGLKQEAKALSGDIDNLNVELNGHNQLDYIEKTAQESFGMVYPSQDKYIYVVDKKGSSEVNEYIETLAASERGAAVQKDVTPAKAAGRLLG